MTSFLVIKKQGVPFESSRAPSGVRLIFAAQVSPTWLLGRYLFQEEAAKQLPAWGESDEAQP